MTHLVQKIVTPKGTFSIGIATLSGKHYVTLWDEKVLVFLTLFCYKMHTESCAQNTKTEQCPQTCNAKCSKFGKIKSTAMLACL